MIRALALALAAAALGGILGWAAGRFLSFWAGLGLAALGLVALIWVGVLARLSPGMEGLAFFVLAVLVIAPATLAAALGAVIARLQENKDPRQ